MFVEMKTIVTKAGFGDKIVEKFSGKSKIQELDGFIEMSVMKRVRKAEEEEIVVEIRWESQEAFTAWKKSDAHKAGHSNKEKADFIVSGKVEMYNVETIKYKEV